MAGESSRARARLCSVLALIVSVAHFASFDIVDQPLITDVRYYVYLAWQTTEGVSPHLSTFDPKTQFATFAGALFLALGEAVGADPLLAMRAGYLGLAAFGGWLVFVFFRRLAGGPEAAGSQVAGFLGLLAYCSYGLIGALPAIGPIPKLGMAICATGAALLVHERRWLGAGAVATLGFLDWQIGAFTCMSVLACALIFGERRWAAAWRVLAGGALMGLPYTLYFVWKGTLGAAFEQTIVSAFFRGSAALKRRTFQEHVFEWLVPKVRADLPEHFYLAPLGLAGVLVAAIWLWRLRGDARLRLLGSVAAVHFGVLGFCLIDFQGHGDLNVLLHGFALFQGCVWVALWLLLRRWLPTPRARSFAALGLLALAVGATRPSLLRPELVVSSPLVSANATLDDQRDVARQIDALTGDRKFAVLESSEYLWFLRRTNPLPTIYWNPGVLSYLRESPEETTNEVLGRMVGEARVEALVRYPAHTRRSLGGPWKTHVVHSENHSVEVLLELFEGF